MTGRESDDPPPAEHVELPPDVPTQVPELPVFALDPNDQTKDHFGLFHPVYVVLHVIRWSAIGKRLPERITMPIRYLMHVIVIVIHDTGRRMRAGKHPFASDRDDFYVAPTEHVRMPSVTVVELFPPSEISSLKRALKKHKWNAAQLRIYPDLAPMLDEARAGTGSSWQWWILGAVLRRGQWAPINPDPVIGALPDEFDAVEFKALQIGEGITVVMAHFFLSETGATYLDEAWHREYQPAINWGRYGGRWPQAQGKKWVAFRAVQEARGAIHSAARRWMRKQCPGAFVANKQPQPLLDVLIFDEFDAQLEHAPSSDVRDALRALGVPLRPEIVRSERIPGMILAAADVGLDSGMEVRRAWSLCGRREALYDVLTPYFTSLGLRPVDSSVVHYVGDTVEEYLLRLSISELLSVYRRKYSTLRDTARQHHTRIRLRRLYGLKSLRTTLVTLSLDLANIDRDVRRFNAAGWPSDEVIFLRQAAPYQQVRDVERGLPTDRTLVMNKLMHERQALMLDELVEIDGDYREILTSAASLTSSIESLRTGRVALWVALAALFVAMVTLLRSEAPQHSQFHELVHDAGQLLHSLIGLITGLF
jgi:hypothetical protein